MYRVIVVVLLLAYASAGTASVFVPADRMPWLVAATGAAIVLAVLVSILAQLGSDLES